MRDINIVAKQISDAYNNNLKTRPTSEDLVEKSRQISYTDQIIGALTTISYLRGSTSEKEWRKFLNGGSAK